MKPIKFPVLGGAPWSDTFGACRGTGCSRTHQGQDLFGPKMRPLVAAVSGTVDSIGYNLSLSGHFVSIRGADGWRYLYIHVNNDTPGTDDGRATHVQAFAPGIHEGARVQAGQTIAYLGDSGNAEGTSPHLHFEIRTPDNVPINPADSLRAASWLWFNDDYWRSHFGPFGAFPLLHAAPGGARIAGWAIDRTTSATGDDRGARSRLAERGDTGERGSGRPRRVRQGPEPRLRPDHAVGTRTTRRLPLRLRSRRRTCDGSRLPSSHSAGWITDRRG